jgi:hypothetical protein
MAPGKATGTAGSTAEAVDTAEAADTGASTTSMLQKQEDDKVEMFGF